MSKENRDKEIAKFVDNLSKLTEFAKELRDNRFSVESNVHNLEKLMMDIGSESYNLGMHIKMGELQYFLLNNESSGLPMIMRISNGNVTISELNVP